MNSGLYSFYCPLRVQMVRQAYVDRIHCSAGEHFLVAAKCMWDVPFISVGLGSLKGSACHCNQLASFGFPDGGDQGSVYVGSR